MSKRILITGGAGYVGTACVQACIEAGHEVVVFDNLSTGKKEKLPEKVPLIEGDVIDRPSLDAVFGSHQFDAVIHLAAKKNIPESAKEPTAYVTVNTFGTLNVLSCMMKYAVPHIVFASTVSVYRGNTSDGQKCHEEDVVEARNMYVQSKLLAEVLIASYQKLGKITSGAILRTANIAGDAGLIYREDVPQSVFPILARSVRQQTLFYLFGTDYPTFDGTCLRDYLHLSDAVSAYVYAIDYAGFSTINIGNGRGYSLREVIAEFEQQAGQTVRIETAPRRAGDSASLVVDSSKAQAALSWQPTRSLREMVADTLRVYSL